MTSSHARIQVNAHFFFAMAWEDCNNYVAKRYMKADTPASVYFDDVKMQMVAKRCGRDSRARATPAPTLPTVCARVRGFVCRSPAARGHALACC